MECLVDHYEYPLTKNTMVISEAYESLETIENWSTDDRKELENEVHNHLEAQEKLLKKQKERKLEMVRRNQTSSPPPPTSRRETYADTLKRQRVNPSNDDRQENWRFPRRVRRLRQERQQQYSNRQYREFRYRSSFQPTGEPGPQYYQERRICVPRCQRFLNEGPSPRGWPRE